MTVSTKPLPTPAQLEQQAEDFLDSYLLMLEKHGDKGVFAVANGEPQYDPREIDAFAALEARGYAKRHNVTTTSYTKGKTLSLTFKITPLGRLRVAEVKQVQAEREFTGEE
jgi:hypothetical protein